MCQSSLLRHSVRPGRVAPLALPLLAGLAALPVVSHGQAPQTGSSPEPGAAYLAGTRSLLEDLHSPDSKVREKAHENWHAADVELGDGLMKTARADIDETNALTDKAQALFQSHNPLSNEEAARLDQLERERNARSNDAAQSLFLLGAIRDRSAIPFLLDNIWFSTDEDGQIYRTARRLPALGALMLMGEDAVDPLLTRYAEAKGSVIIRTDGKRFIDPPDCLWTAILLQSIVGQPATIGIVEDRLHSTAPSEPAHKRLEELRDTLKTLSPGLRFGYPR